MDFTENDLNNVFTDLLKKSRDKLISTKKEDLRKNYFHFEWDDNYSKTWNIYQFSSALESYKRNCRDWETHHNGYSCVVERVRDEYLYPVIKEFEELLDKYDK